MPDRLRVGVLGCASIADRFLLPAFVQHKHYDLVAIGSRSKGKATKLAAKYETKALMSYTSVLQESLDVVYVPLPNALHFEWIQKSLEKGFHVISEKSLACNHSQVKSLVELAERQQLLLFENFQFRFHPQLAAIVSAINKGSIGEIRLIRSQFGFPPFADKKNIRYQQALGGGALLDAGAYPVKIAQLLLGHELSVDTAAIYSCPTLGVDLWGDATLSSEGPCRAQIGFGFDNEYVNNVEVWGSEGMISADRIFTAGPGVVPRVITKRRGDTTVQEFGGENHFINMLDYFYEACRNRNKMQTENLHNLNQSRFISEIIDCAAR